MTRTLILISHPLCPYVQRAAIVLAEKDVTFERRDVDLRDKPAWFLALSPLGRTPVLLVDGDALFESAVICEYLDETHQPRLHPAPALERARHRAWMAYGSELLDAIGAFYRAKDKGELEQRRADIRSRLARLEAVLGNGPFFGGAAFGMVDAVFGPAFRYFDVFEAIDDFGFFAGLPKVGAWREQLSRRPSVRGAVGPDYARLLWIFLKTRQSALAERMRDRPEDFLRLPQSSGERIA